MTHESEEQFFLSENLKHKSPIRDIIDEEIIPNIIKLKEVTLSP
jgi:hypothetical protein